MDAAAQQGTTPAENSRETVAAERAAEAQDRPMGGEEVQQHETPGDGAAAGTPATDGRLGSASLAVADECLPGGGGGESSEAAVEGKPPAGKRPRLIV